MNESLHLILTGYVNGSMPREVYAMIRMLLLIFYCSAMNSVEQFVKIYEEGDVIKKYKPICSDCWRQERCQFLGLDYIILETTPHIYSSHCCFLYQSALQQWQGLNLMVIAFLIRSIALAVTGSQENPLTHYYIYDSEVLTP